MKIDRPTNIYEFLYHQDTSLPDFDGKATVVVFSDDTAKVYKSDMVTYYAGKDSNGERPVMGFIHKENIEQEREDSHEPSILRGLQQCLHPLTGKIYVYEEFQP